MENIKEDVTAVLFANAQYIENDAIWVGADTGTPELTLSEELVGKPNFLENWLKKSFLYDLFLLLKSPVE